jgi:hypothetical protein
VRHHSVALLSPVDGQVVTGVVTVSAVATDDGLDPRVQFTLDGSALGAELRRPPYTYQWDTRAAVNGVHQLAAVARDVSGNVVRAAVTLRVQNPAIPQGVFSLPAAFTPVPDDILASPLVAGISARGQWPRVEPLEGQYDWSYFDGELARAAAAGKHVLLRIAAGGRNTPDWVFDLGVQTFAFEDRNASDPDFGTTVTIPVFWDPMLLAKKRQLIVAMGARFAGHPAVSLVSVNCAAALTDDWNVPHTPTDVAGWLALGYTSDKVIAACVETIDAAMTAFPDTLVVMAVGQTSAALDPDPDYVARRVVEYAQASYPGRFIVQKNSLSATTPDPAETSTLRAWQIVWDSQPLVGGQMLWFVTSDPACRMNGLVSPCDPATTLLRAVTTGAHYDLQYQEIYQQDIRNPALADVVRQAADLLTRPTPPSSLTASASGTEITLDWAPATDGLGVGGYRIVRNGIEIATTVTPGYRDENLEPSTTYSYRVSAFDAAGNESPAASASAITEKSPRKRTSSTAARGGGEPGPDPSR